MSDGQVSVEGKTHILDPPFLVIATQNPYEFEGTYVLPESQLDRFMIRLRMGYPLRSEERRVLSTHRAGEPVESLRPVLTGEDVRRLQMAVRKVRVDDAIAEYLLDIVHATREGDELHVGVSTRGALTLYRAAQGLALVSGRDYVVPDDIKSLAVPGPLAPGRRQVVPPGRRVRRRRGDHPRHRRPAPRPDLSRSTRPRSDPRSTARTLAMPERSSKPIRRFARWVGLEPLAEPAAPVDPRGGGLLRRLARAAARPGCSSRST